VPRKWTLLVVEHEKECPPAHLGRWLTEAGAELAVRRPYLGEPLPDLAAYDGLVVLGGSMAADDDALHAWIGPTKELLRSAVADGVPTLGICLGHQLLASALGGRVTANPSGQRLGLVEIGWTDAAGDDPLLGGLVDGSSRRGVHWNHDIVIHPPPGAELLAATPAGEVQALRYGPRAWGVQWHPEVDVPVLVSWAEGDRADHLERGIDQQALLDEIDAARAELDTAWRPLASRFSELVARSRVP
jgi:GMP synthase (glutamine-hydrolysing)